MKAELLLCCCWFSFFNLLPIMPAMVVVLILALTVSQTYIDIPEGFSVQSHQCNSTQEMLLDHFCNVFPSCNIYFSQGTKLSSSCFWRSYLRPVKTYKSRCCYFNGGLTFGHQCYKEQFCFAICNLFIAQLFVKCKWPDGNYIKMKVFIHRCIQAL